METIIIENLNRDQFLHFPFQSTSIEEEGEAKEAARDPVAGDHDLHQKREALRH